MEEIGALTKSVVGGLEDGILTQAEKNEAINQPDQIRTDWYDESYTRW